MKLLSGVRRYPLVALTLAVAVVGLTLSVSDAAAAVPWVVSGYALAVTAWTAVGMIRQLRHGVGIDVLAVTAVTAAVVVGEYWAALVVVFMLASGAALEDYAANRARRDLSALLAKAPASAHLRAADGSTRDVPIDDIVPGDEVLVRPAEVVPIDGVLVSDLAELDESSLTGESLPVERTAGEEVLSGGVNGAVAVVIRATRSARDSQYQQIVALVEQATKSRSRTVRLADRFAVPFTLAALTLGVIAWWISGEGVRFAEVLVVATPCPLLIAAPVAFMGGMSRSAREGIIVKSSEALEKFDRARTVAFDKTGTLTYGHPALSRVIVFGDSVAADEPGQSGRLLALAASAEVYSSHVLAASVVAGARDRGLALTPASEPHEVPAHGICAVVDDHEVVVGKRSYVATTTGIEVPTVELIPGEMAVYVGVDGVASGVLTLRDELSKEAAGTIAALRSYGVRHIMMLTGDQRATAEHIAAALDIDEIHAECLPLDKVEAVESATDRPVVMVGDGVNDAPVLAAADVGIAMGARGATAASESADAVILSDSIFKVAVAIAIGQQTIRVALQSIWVGIGLSFALMLVATFGYLPALVGAWAQEGVDLAAILWALRATTRRPVDATPMTHQGRRAVPSPLV